MNKHHLDLKWTHEFSLSDISACCSRLDRSPLPNTYTTGNIQKELIQNERFADHYMELVQKLPDEPVEKEEPKPASSAYGYGRSKRYSYEYNTKPAKGPSRRSTLLTRLSDLLEAFWENGCDITAYSQDDILDVLNLDRLYNEDRLVYLENFTCMRLSEEHRLALAENIRSCISVPVKLSESQKKLLLKPYAARLSLFPSAPFEEIWALLEKCPVLLEIIRLFYDKEVNESLHLEHYEIFSGDAEERYQLLNEIIAQLEPRAASEFLGLWKKNDCSLYELQSMARQMRRNSGLDWETVFSNYSGYVNLLYGTRFKTIDLSDVMSYQEEILIYAIVKNKKRFIRLVEENANLFLSLGSDSLLFNSNLYEEHFNLNELTEKTLADCSWMKANKLQIDELTPGRQYTFPELRALYGLTNVYVSLYNKLVSDSQDYRLIALKQLAKRNVLKRDMDESDISALAEKLSIKPLYNWQREEFGHIRDLQAIDITQQLIHLDALRHLVPYIHCRTDALLVLRNISVLERFDTVEALKEDIVQVDSDWRYLTDEMDLSNEFQTRFRENIIRFLCNNGAYIARTYYSCLYSSQKDAYLRVIKAELMGEFETLKYFEGDLQRELDYPLSNHMKNDWKTNLHVQENGILVEERDDFISTMLLGVQPSRTCLSYVDGAHRECLLSSFDTNKKLLYATMGGQVVGRAFIRLTKGRLTDPNATAEEKKSDFTFVDVENMKDSRPTRVDKEEYITLFLERPYVAGVSPEVQKQIIAMFTEIAVKKADEIGSMLVLSNDYQSMGTKGFTWTRFNIYISKTKAGAQYLDSLGGEATVSTEGSYKSNSFLIREHSDSRSMPKACGQ